MYVVSARPARRLKSLVDDFPHTHVEAAMDSAQALGQFTDHKMIVARLVERFDKFGTDLDIAMSAAQIEIVMLHKCRGRQDDICKLGGIGHKLFMHAQEQILPAQARY